MAQKPAIHANVSPESHEAWHQFGEEHGVTASGLITSFIEALLDVDLDLTAEVNPANPMADMRDDLTVQARRVDAGRRRRRTPQKEVKTLHAVVGTEAHDRWHDYCAEQGISVSGLLEAIGEILQNPTPQTTNALAGTILQGRKYDAAARRRHGRKADAQSR